MLVLVAQLADPWATVSMLLLILCFVGATVAIGCWLARLNTGHNASAIEANLPTALRCSHCGVEVEAVDQTCPRCGQPQSELPPSAAAAYSFAGGCLGLVAGTVVGGLFGVGISYLLFWNLRNDAGPNATPGLEFFMNTLFVSVAAVLVGGAAGLVL